MRYIIFNMKNDAFNKKVKQKVHMWQIFQQNNNNNLKIIKYDTMHLIVQTRAPGRP